MTHGIVTAPQPEAVEAGAEALQAGGNAVDAAIACALVQTAVDPMMCGIAGFGSMHVYMPGKGIHTCLDFHGRAPKSASEDMWADRIISETEDGFGFVLEGRINEVGYGSITTPMSLKAYDEALKRFGTMELGPLLEPAIHYAEDGFVVRPHVRYFWNMDESKLGRAPQSEKILSNPEARKIYARPDGSIPELGHVVKNPDMGKTLRRIAEHGVSDFYQGKIADQIAFDMAANGGHAHARRSGGGCGRGDRTALGHLSRLPDRDHSAAGRGDHGAGDAQHPGAFRSAGHGPQLARLYRDHFRGHEDRHHR